MNPLRNPHDWCDAAAQAQYEVPRLTDLDEPAGSTPSILHPGPDPGRARIPPERLGGATRGRHVVLPPRRREGRHRIVHRLLAVLRAAADRQREERDRGRAPEGP